MIRSINEKSVYAIRYYAKTIPKIIANLEESTQTLINTYHNVENYVVPYSDRLYQRLIYIKENQEEFSDTINELSKRLLKTAQAIENYLHSDSDDADGMMRAVLENRKQFIDRQDSMLGREEKRKRIPSEKTKYGIEKGRWNGNKYYFSDDYIPNDKKLNPDGKTMRDIKQALYKDYGLKVGGISFENDEMDLSDCALVKISYEDVMERAVIKMSKEEKRKFQLEGMTDQERRLKKLQAVFCRERRSANFQIADELLAIKQIPFPGLICPYTADQVAEWRQERGFSWDEQVAKGYLLVPTIIHRQLVHIGLVGISESAIENYRKQQESLKDNPKTYAFSEEEAPISIQEVMDK